MPPWNAAGTRLSSGPVTAAGSVKVSCPAVPMVSRAAIERAIDQRQRRRAQHPAPERKLRDPLRRPARPPPAAAPSAATTFRVGGQRGLLARPRPPPTPPQGRAPGCATTPRPPPGGGSSAADARPRAAPGIEPDRLHHHAGRGCEPHLRRLRLLGDAGAPRLLAEAADIHPPQAGRAHRHVAGRRDLQRELTARCGTDSRSRSAS